ncbi:MAG: hypothetical protein C4524_05960 [Candidatus Zixiibacteriota bacterium]|nr:MAG: hypothetical protein C4524_05960 [candidate division Zixibacteria bacterium]
MAFMDPFNYWSALHLIGSFVLTLTLGSLDLPVSPAGSGLLVFGAGAAWEAVADGALLVNDPRGGDLYDLAWDLAGCAAGWALLEAGRDYRQSLRPRNYGFTARNLRPGAAPSADFRPALRFPAPHSALPLTGAARLRALWFDRTPPLWSFTTLAPAFPRETVSLSGP